jgi:hypothetical protein
MPGRDTPREEAHDVLAAEAFAVPAPDPSLRARPITLPDDPSGIAEPHDVLAAEEFAMPAPRSVPEAGARALAFARGRRSPLLILAAAVASLVLTALRRRRRV